MEVSEYGKDFNGAKQGSLTPLSRIKFNDINTAFADLLNRDLRRMKRERREALVNGDKYEVDELTLEAADELSLMIAHATANERGMPIRAPKKFDVSAPQCPGCKHQVKLYRAGLCRPCYAARLGWSSIKKK